MLSGMASNTRMLRNLFTQEPVLMRVILMLLSEGKELLSFLWHTVCLLFQGESIHGFHMLTLVTIYHNNEHLYTTWQFSRELWYYNVWQTRKGDSLSKVTKSQKWQMVKSGRNLRPLLIFLKYYIITWRLMAEIIGRYIFLTSFWFFAGMLSSKMLIATHFKFALPLNSSHS